MRIAVERGKKFFERNFYIVVLFKKERLFQNIIRQYFFPRLSCPLPEYDQVVYQYYRRPERLEFLWVIPDRETTLSLPRVKNKLPPEQKEIAKFCEDFIQGKLDALCAEKNKVFDNVQKAG